MGEEILKITHKGNLQFGEIKIPCAVLEDGTRVLSETSISNAILKSRSGASIRKKNQQNDRSLLPVFLASDNLKPFINADLEVGAHLITYYDGKREIKGYDAIILPLACDVWLKAREAGALKPSQLDKAQNAEILMRSLAKVGIIALIDEATGYQEDRERYELQRLLSYYVAKELLPWTKTFPDEFYVELFRLRGWDYKGKAKSPYVGKLTNYLVYDRLPPEVVEELKRLNPIIKDKGYRKNKLFQNLTKENGYVQLKTLIASDITMMRGFDSWDEFNTIYRKSYNIQETLEEDQDKQIS